MKTENIASELIFKIVGNDNENALVPVHTESCSLSDNPVGQEKCSCVIHRRSQGALLQSPLGRVLLNGNPAQPQWLNLGDRIEVGTTVYEIVQLGSFSPAAASRQAVNYNNSTHFRQESGLPEKLESRIDQLQDELKTQAQSFELVNQRFDSLSQQIAALLELVNEKQTICAPTQVFSQTPTDFITESEFSSCRGSGHDPMDELPIQALVASDPCSELDVQPQLDAIENLSTDEDSPDTESADMASAVWETLSNQTGFSDTSPPSNEYDNTRDSEESLDRLLASLNSNGQQTELESLDQPVSVTPDLETSLQLSPELSQLENLFASLRSQESESSSYTASVNFEPPPETFVEPNDLVPASFDRETNLVDIDPSTTTAVADEVPVHTEPESVSEILARLQLGDQLQDLENSCAADLTNEPAPAPAPEPDHLNSEAKSHTEVHSQANSDDNLEVSDYMSSLLRRLKGSDNDQPSLPSSQIQQSTPKADRDKSVNMSQANEISGLLDPSEFVPKRVVPEKKANISAMRELAIATSRSALQSSKLKRKQESAGSLIIFAVSSLMAAIVTLFFSRSQGDLFYYLSILFFVVTTVCSGICAKNFLIGQPASQNEGTEPNSQHLWGWQLLAAWFKQKLSRSPEAQD